MDKVTVLITGVGGGGVGRQVLKSLLHSETAYNIIGTDMTDISMGLYEVDEACIVPHAYDDDYIPTLLGLCKKYSVEVLIPGSEPELAVLSENRDIFRRKKILLLVNNKAVISTCMDKLKLAHYLQKNGYPCPPFGVGKHISGDIYPAIVKPTIASGGSNNVHIVQNDEELAFFAGYLDRQGLIPMVQQYVGSYDEEYTVGVLTDIKDGTLIGSIALKRMIKSGLSNRIRIKNMNKQRIKDDMLIVSSGISQGEIDDYEDVRDICEKVALDMKCRGPMNMQCRKEGNNVYIFEINPRFSGTTYIRALVGYNEPDILIRKHILGEEIEPIRFKKGIVMRGLEERYEKK